MPDASVSILLQGSNYWQGGMHTVDWLHSRSIWYTYMLYYILLQLTIYSIDLCVHAVGPSLFSSYEQEQASQVDKLLKTFPFLDSNQTLLLGGFAHGPTIDRSIIGTFSRQHKMMIHECYISPYANKTRATGECTVCFGNPLAEPARRVITSVFSNVDLNNSTDVSSLKAELTQNNVVDFNILYYLTRTNALNFSDPSLYQRINSGNATSSTFDTNPYGFIVDHIYVPQTIVMNVLEARV